MRAIYIPGPGIHLITVQDSHAATLQPSHESHAVGSPNPPNWIQPLRLTPEAMWSPRLCNLIYYYVILFFRRMGSLFNRYLS
jgi:hypothetical protein